MTGRRRLVDPNTSPFRLRISRSRLQGTGVFACEAIPPRRKVVEYTGEHITWREAFRRLDRGNPYIFRLNRRCMIDGSVQGGGAQFVNHSCAPNLHVRRGPRRILLMSLRRIRAGEELTFDYKLSPRSRIVTCRCGAPRCRGTLNRRPR